MKLTNWVSKPKRKYSEISAIRKNQWPYTYVCLVGLKMGIFLGGWLRAIILQMVYRIQIHVFQKCSPIIISFLYILIIKALLQNLTTQNKGFTWKLTWKMKHKYTKLAEMEASTALKVNKYLIFPKNLHQPKYFLNIP